MNFNDSLLNGDMVTVKELLSKGETWVGDKTGFDDHPITHPVDPREFAEQLKLILDLEMIDGNRFNYTWYFSPDINQCSQLSGLQISSRSDSTFQSIISCFIDCLDSKDEFEPEDDYYDPQILISRLCKGQYQVIIQCYLRSGTDEVLDLIVDDDTILDIFAGLSGIKVYTC